MTTLIQSTLTQSALDALDAATRVPPDVSPRVNSARGIWEPASWLLHAVVEALTASLNHPGVGDAALAVTALARPREPLAPARTVHALARHHVHHNVTQPNLHALARAQLAEQRDSLLAAGLDSRIPAETRAEELLLAAAAAAHLEDASLAFACLERLDRATRGWDTVIVRPDLRTLLAQTLARLDLNPLTTHLIASAVRRFDETGVVLLGEIARWAVVSDEAMSEEENFLHEADLVAPGATPPSFVPPPLLRLCVQTLEETQLVQLHSRRVAATVFARAAQVDAVVDQLAIIAAVQEARRASGLNREVDEATFRRVKRPQANADIDFQAYTLQSAIHALPLAHIRYAERVQLAQQMAALGTRSDGWTAAASATALIRLGAIGLAIDVVKSVDASDPTRSEGLIDVVRALLAVGEGRVAGEQVQAALQWAAGYDGRNPERAITWGLAELFLERREPSRALDLLARRVHEPSLRERLRNLFRRTGSFGDDELRDGGLRLRALLQQQASAPSAERTKEIRVLVETLRKAAPRLLEGEALVNFYGEGLLRPLLAGGEADVRALAWPLLDEVGAALAALGGRHAARTAEVSTLLAEQVAGQVAGQVVQKEGDFAEAAANESGDASASAGPPEPAPVSREVFATFLRTLWQRDAERGLWQTVYGVEGGLPLLLALEGPGALVELAQAVDARGPAWMAQQEALQLAAEAERNK